MLLTSLYEVVTFSEYVLRAVPPRNGDPSMKSPLARATVATAAVALAAVLAAPAALADTPSSRPADNAARAAASFAALQKYLAVQDGSLLYHERVPVQSGDNAYSYEWPFSQAHMAALDLTGLPGAAGWSYQKALST